MTAQPTIQQRFLSASGSTRAATRLSLAEIKHAAHYAAVACEMLEFLRGVCIAAKARNVSIEPASIITWLDENTPQLDPKTATRETQHEL